jgi:hypothetical protein
MDVSEEYGAANFNVEEEAKEETNMKNVASSVG